METHGAEGRHTESVLPEVESNADLDGLHVAPPPTPPRFSLPLCEVGIPTPGAGLPPAVLLGQPEPLLARSPERNGPPPGIGQCTRFGPGATLLRAGQCPFEQVPPHADDPGQPGGLVHVHSPFSLLLDIIGRVTRHPTETILKI